MNIDLKLISDETVNNGFDYDERIRIYECPCGKDKIVWSKERPNGQVLGYQATFSDVFCYCEECKNKYVFDRIKGSAILNN